MEGGAAMMRQCSCCGTWFEADAPWKKTCLRCWKQKKVESGEWDPGYRRRARATVYQSDSEISELERLRADITILEGDNQRLKRPLANAEERIEEVAGIREHLPRLIQLCHPDKHGNSKPANEATAWLLRRKRTLLTEPA